MFTYGFRRLTALKTINIDGRLSHLKEAKDMHHRGISSNRLETDNDHDANCDTYLRVMLMKSIGDSGLKSKNFSVLRKDPYFFTDENFRTISLAGIAAHMPRLNAGRD